MPVELAPVAAESRLKRDGVVEMRADVEGGVNNDRPSAVAVKLEVSLQQLTHQPRQALRRVLIENRSELAELEEGPERGIKLS